MTKIIVADAGPLIAFGRIKQLSLLAALGTIIVPASVWNECTADKLRPGAIEIIDARDNKTIELHINPDMHNYESLLDILGIGEASAIVLASQLKALLLIDDKLGRETAQKMNIPIIGTAGILLHAKEKKIIKKVAPLMQGLKDSGYYLSEELIKIVLERAKE